MSAGRTILPEAAGAGPATQTGREAEACAVQVAGARIAYSRWGPRRPDGCILVHGVAAHGRWWDHVAPALAQDRAVVALDLSGHGDSGRRDEYSREMWADEIAAVADEEGMRRPVLLGHSLGGMVALRAAAMYPQRFGGVVTMESNILEQRLPPENDPAALLTRPLRVYDSRAEAVSRWRPLPDEPVGAEISEHVAQHSVREVEGGWTWKFDPKVFEHAVMLQQELVPLEVPAVLYRGQTGSVPRDRLRRIADLVGPGTPHFTLPGVGHNVMLGSPDVVTIVLRTLFAAWQPAR